MQISKQEFFILKLRIKAQGPIKVTIASGSMSPLIKTGERVQVEYRQDYQPFDTVVYHHSDGRLICHYVWQRSELNPGAYLLRSLQGQGFDLPVAEDSILGHVPHRRVTAMSRAFIALKLLGQRVGRGLLGH